MSSFTTLDATTSKFCRLGLDIEIAVANFTEGFCYRYGIPKHERQLVTFFGGILSRDNYEAVSQWVHEQICASDAHDVSGLRNEIESKFSAMIEHFD